MGGSSVFSGKRMKWRNFLLDRRNPKNIVSKAWQMKLSSSPSVFCCYLSNLGGGLIVNCGVYTITGNA